MPHPNMSPIGKEKTETTPHIFTNAHSAAGFSGRINWRVTAGFPHVLLSVCWEPSEP